MKAENENALETVAEYYPSCVNTGIDKPTFSGDVKRVEYFTTDGVRIDAPQNGISIRRTTFANGQVVTDKVLKK